MDRLQAMTTFVAVVETGGFASAARKLDLSPPVVTRAVAELESRLGLRLLTRCASTPPASCSRATCCSGRSSTPTACSWIGW